MDASRFHKSRITRGSNIMSDTPKAKQLLHLVFGGELDGVANIEFKDLERLDIVGVFPNYASAYAAWKAKAQGSVDNAEMRYFIVHLHRLLDPESPALQR
jgi:Domain of unknown function (DUF4170)